MTSRDEQGKALAVTGVLEGWLVGLTTIQTMPGDRYKEEEKESLRGQVQTLQRVVGNLNEVVASLGPQGDLVAVRRKVLSLEARISQLERRGDLIPAGRPYSE